MRKSLIFMAAVAASAASANAATVVVTDGPPAVPPFNTVYTFAPGDEGPFDPANVRNASANGLYAQPAGSEAPFYSVGPSTSNPVTISYASTWGNQFYLFWGSIDSYNAIEVLDAANTVIATITGADVASPPTGNQTEFNQNRNVTVTLTAGERALASSLRFRSDFGQAPTNAFEFDNFAVNAVPEPTTWAMMLAGFGFIGSFMRRAGPARLRFA